MRKRIGYFREAITALVFTTATLPLATSFLVKLAVWFTGDSMKGTAVVGITSASLTFLLLGIFDGSNYHSERTKGLIGTALVVQIPWLIWAAHSFLGHSHNVTSKTIKFGLPVFLAATVFLIYDYWQVKRAHDVRKKELVEESKKSEEKEHLIEQIKMLIGNQSQTTALLAAIERLTEYVPDISNKLLTAVVEDAERFVMLRGLESTTSNDVLRQKCKDEADEIARTARKLCADSTEMALELLAEHQGIEAENRLGESYEPRLVGAHKDFQNYLVGLREALPVKDGELSRNIEALSPPKAEPIELKKRTMIIGGVSSEKI